jgi:hypothetical protein
MAPKPTKPDRDDERISLHGHDPETVLRALLKVDPDSEPAQSEQDDRSPKKPRTGKSP